MAAVLIIAIVLVLAIGAYFLVNQPQNKPTERRSQWTSVGGALHYDVISQSSGGKGDGGVYVPPVEPFRHTLQSSVACGYLLAFLEIASKIGLFKMESVQLALGKANLKGWDYAKSSLGISQPVTSVVIPALIQGTLTAGTAVVGSFASVVALITQLAGLDSDIKKGIAESEACLRFVHRFSEVWSLPPMALLNMLSNLVPDSGNYGLIRGASGTLDRSKEPGVGIVADMAKLYNALKSKGWLQGMRPIRDIGMYRNLVSKGEIKCAINNNIGKLKVTGRGFGYWPHYAWSVDHLFSQPRRWKWGQADKMYRYAASAAFERTGDPARFDKQATKLWLEAGGEYVDTYKGYLQPGILIFEVGHDPGLDTYGGFDTGFLGGLANQTAPQFGEGTWLTRYNTDTNGGWLYVS